MKILFYLFWSVLLLLSSQILAQPIVNLGADTSHCGSYLLDADNAGATHLWSTGETTRTIVASTSGTYWVDVQDGTGTTRDSIDLIIYTNPTIGSRLVDSSYCGGIISLSTGVTNSTILWYDSTGYLLASADTLLYDLVAPAKLYYEASNLVPTGISTVGLPKDFTVAGAANYRTGQNTRGMRFDVLQDFTLKSVWMSVNGPFSATLVLNNGAGATLETLPISFAAAGDYKVELNFDLAIGNDYEMLLTGMSGAGSPFTHLPVSWSNYTYPFLDMKAGAGSGNSAMYRFFYEWETYFAPNGNCVGDKDTVDIGLSPSPFVDLGNDTLVCGNSLLLDATFSAGTATVYSWSTGATTPSILVTSSGQYMVTLTEAGQCQAIDTINVIIQSYTTILNPLADSAYCGGSVVLAPDLSTPLLGTVLWYDANDCFLAAGDSLAINLQAPTTYYYESTNVVPTGVGTVGLPKDFTVAGTANYRTGQNTRGMLFDVLQPFLLRSVWMSVNGAFSATLELRNAAGTIIETVPINFAAAGDYKVALNFDLPIGNDYQMLLTGMSGGSPFTHLPVNWSNYTYPFLDLKAGAGSGDPSMYRFFYDWETYFTPNGTCISDRDTVNVGLSPSPFVDLGNDTVVCGNSLVLDATFAAGTATTYLWSTGATTASINVTTSGNYEVTLTEAGICEAADRINVVFEDYPQVVNPIADSSYCAGIQSFGVNTTAGVGEVLWYDNDGSLIATNSTIDYTVENSTAIYYQSSNVQATTSATIGRPKDFLVSGSGYYIPGQNGRGMLFDVLQDFLLKSVWMSVDGAFSATIELIDGTGSTIYTTPINFATAGDYKVVLNYDLPLGTNYQILLTGMTGGNPFSDLPVSYSDYTYSFLDLKAGQGGSAAMYRFFYEWETYFKTSNNVCFSPLDTINLTLLPSPVIDLGVDSVVCGDSLVLDASYGGASPTYRWNSFTTASDFTATTTGRYSVTATENGICSASDTIELVFFSAPKLSTNLQDTAYCRGDALLVGSASVGTVFWFNDNGIVLETGDSLVYDLQTPQTIYYAASNLVPVGTMVGQSATFRPTATGSYINGQNGRGMTFDVYQQLSLGSVKMSVNAAFSATIELRDNNGILLYSTPITFAQAGNYAVNLDYDIAVGSDYVLLMTNMSGGIPFSDIPIDFSPFTYSFLKLKGGFGGDARMYRFFYDWKVFLTPNGSCLSPLDSVQLDTVITPFPNLVDDAIYCRDTAMVDASFVGASYSWSTGSTNSSIAVAQDGLYVVTNTLGNCTAVDSTIVYLNPIPLVQLVSTDTTTCVGTIPRVAIGNADHYAWFDDEIGGTAIGKGASFEYNAQSTDTIWVEAANYSEKEYTAGQIDTFVTEFSDYFFPDQIRGVVFDVQEDIRLKDVQIYIAQTPFIGTVQLWDENDVPIDSAVNLVATSVGKNTLTLNFDIAAGQDYKLVLTQYNTTALLSERFFFYYPIVNNGVTIKNGLPDRNKYEYFYEWNIQKLSCPTPRLPNIVTVLPTPTIDFPNDTIVCGDSIRLDASNVNATNFQWSTGETTTSILLNTTQTVGLIATLGICTDEDSTNVMIVEPPTLVVPPNDTTICEGDLTLFASGNAPYYAWYTSQASNNPILLGDSIIQSFSDTTTLWVEGVGFLPNGDYVGIDKGDFSNLEVWISPQTSLYPTRGLDFVVNSPIRLDELSIYVDDTTAATLTILRGGFPVYTQNLNLTTVGENIITLNTLLEAGSYTIELSSVVGGRLLMVSPINNIGQFNTQEINFVGSTPLSSQYLYFYKWRVSTPSCATDRLPFTVSVPAPPQLTLVADTATCTQSSLTLQSVANPIAGYTYAWSTGATTDSLVVSTTDYYTVTVTNNGQCSSSKNIYVQFLTTPAMQDIADQSICTPQTIALRAPLNDGILVWYQDSSLSGVTAINSPYEPFVADTTIFWSDVAPRAVTRLGQQASSNANKNSSYYNFIIANTFDMQQHGILDSVAIYVADAPATIEIQLLDSLNNLLYSQTTVVNQAREKVFIPLDFNLVPSSGYQLTFNNMTTPVLVDQNALQTTKSSANIATLTGTVFAGINYTTFFDWHFSYAYPTCHAVGDSALVTVDVPTVLPDSVYTCDTILLSMEHPIGQAYQWSTGATTSSIVANAAGLYIVTVTTSSCTIIDSTVVTKPKEIFAASLNASCDFLLQTNYEANEASFLWETQDTTASIQIPSIGTYTVTVTTNDGCVLADSVTITQIVLPPLPNLLRNVNACFFDTLDATVIGIGMSYLWSTGDTTSTLVVNSSDFYSVTVTHPLGCTGTDFSIVDIDTIPVAGFTFSLFNQKDVSFNNTTTGINSGTTFRWEMGDAAGTTYTLPFPFHSYDSVKCYDVTLYVNDVCGVDTAFYENVLNVPDSVCTDTTVSVFQLAGVELLPFEVMPNPNEGQFSVQLANSLEEETKLQLLDINGRVVYRKILPVGNQMIWEIQPDGLPSGVYFAQLSNSRQRQTRRVVVLK